MSSLDSADYKFLPDTLLTHGSGFPLSVYPRLLLFFSVLALEAQGSKGQSEGICREGRHMFSAVTKEQSPSLTLTFRYLLLIPKAFVWIGGLALQPLTSHQAT